MATRKTNLLTRYWRAVSTCCLAKQEREDDLSDAISLHGTTLVPTIPNYVALFILSHLVCCVRSHNNQITDLSKLCALASDLSPLRRPLNQPPSVIFLGIVARTQFVFAVTARICREFMQLCAFDAASMQWQDLGTMSYPYKSFRWTSASSAIVDNENGRYLYVAGGQGYPSKRVYRLNLESKVWERLPYMHRERCGADVVVLEGHVCIIGGYINVGHEKYEQNSGEIWGEKSKEWREMREMWPAHLFGGKKQNYGGEPEVVVVMEALYAIDRTSGEVMRFDTHSKLWLSAGPLPATSHKGWFQLVPVGEELWVVSNKSSESCFAASTTKYPLSWQPVLPTSCP